MRSTPQQPFSNDHDPDLAQIVDDFLAELDRLLRPDEPPPDTKEKQ